MKSTTGRSNFDRFSIITSLVIVSIISIFFLTNPDQAIKIAGDIFTLIAYNFGTPILWYAFGLVILAAFFLYLVNMGISEWEMRNLSFLHFPISP